LPDFDLDSGYGPRFRGDPIRCWKTQPRNLEEAKQAGWDGPGCKMALDGYVESL
jgi:hypothetical protein